MSNRLGIVRLVPPSVAIVGMVAWVFLAARQPAAVYAQSKPTQAVVVQNTASQPVPVVEGLVPFQEQFAIPATEGTPITFNTPVDKALVIEFITARVLGSLNPVFTVTTTAGGRAVDHYFGMSGQFFSNSVRLYADPNTQVTFRFANLGSFVVANGSVSGRLVIP